MSGPLPPLIALEEHALMQDPPKEITDHYGKLSQVMGELVPNLQEIGPRRLAAMNSGDVSLQVVSHTPGLSTQDPEYSRRANDQLLKAVKDQEAQAGGGDGKRRFAGFAVLPMSNLEASATELRRCIKELGFCGALVDNHAKGKFYNGSEYDVFWREAEALDTPIYLHPTWPEQAMTDARYAGENLSETSSFIMGGPGFGWHFDTAVHVLRLFAAGVFDRFPKLKIIIGHMGEMLPFQLERVIKSSRAYGPKQRPFRQVWDENLWITTSGNWSVDPMACLLRNTKLDRIMYSVDYPFQSHEASKEFLLDLRKSGLVDESAFKGICYLNAERLLGVHAPARV